MTVLGYEELTIIPPRLLALHKVSGLGGGAIGGWGLGTIDTSLLRGKILVNTIECSTKQNLLLSRLMPTGTVQSVVLRVQNTVSFVLS